MLPLLFKKEQHERFALGHKKGKSSEKLSKSSKNMIFFDFFRAKRPFLRLICSNHEYNTHLDRRERFAHCPSFVTIDLRIAHGKERQEQFVHSRFFLKSDESELLTVAQ